MVRQGFFKRSLMAISLMICMQAGAVTDGKWRGDLELRGVRLPLVFNFKNTGNGLSCSLDSPAQNAYGIKLNVDYESADSVAVTAPSIGAAFRGHVSADTVAGVFEQSGMKFPLTLVPEEPLSVRRPQTPVPPYPYQTTDTVFRSADGTLLSGTIAFPISGDGRPFPMVVMVTGSGPQNRDEEIFEHRPFAVIADYLSRNGIASFRYDDRGTGASQGSFSGSTTDTFLQDAVAALNFAGGVDGVGKVGIIGHSEGGTIAFMAASEGMPDFIISLAGMAVSGKETLLAQNRHSLEKSGLSEEIVEGSMKVIEAAFNQIAEQEGNPENVDIDSIAESLGVELPFPLMLQIKTAAANLDPLFRRLLTVDVRPVMERIKCPVLAINGQLDTQIDATSNLNAIKEGIPQTEIHDLPNLNHLLQHARTGEINEYQEIRETMSPEVLQLIADFVAKQR